MTTPQEPTVITLNNKNSLQILSKYIEVTQSKGVFLLEESNVLKRCFDVLIHGVEDRELSQDKAKELLFQGIYRGQGHGDYSVNDSALLYNVIEYLKKNVEVQEQPTQSVQPTQTVPLVGDGNIISDEADNEDDFDLSELSQPVPLKPREF